MTPEKRRSYRKPADVFGLTEREQLYYMVSDKRFRELLADEQTTVHRITVDHNAFGEYIFVTLGRTDAGQPALMTFYGYGYHEQREQWIHRCWYWYGSHPGSTMATQNIPKEAALRQIQTRYEEIAAHITDDAPSERAVLFAIIADLTDEDAALTELEDLEDMGYFDHNHDDDE